MSGWRRWLGRLAAGGGSPAPVFAAIGPGFRDRVEDLGLDPRVELVASPRHATIVLVAGAIPDRLHESLARVHDQVPPPRARLSWQEGRPVEEIATEAAALHRALLAGETDSQSHLLADEPPALWRGKGDHGQGGEGMMGGKPYGRPMAMTMDDLRDGLALDALTFRIGPFFPHLPPGLVLELTLQGDVVHSVGLQAPPFAQPPMPRREAAEAALRAVARTLRAAGAPALAERAHRAALTEDGGGEAARLERLLRRTGTLALLPEAAGVRERTRGRLRSAAAGEAPDEEPAPLSTLPDLLPGLEWGEAVVALATLPLVATEPPQAVEAA